jgi:hypothetical protein
VKYPAIFEPTSTERFELANGDVVAVPKATPRFARWSGAAPGSSFGNKPILEWRGRPVFAELAILRAWEAEGWQGVWVDSFGKRLLSEYWPQPVVAAVPPTQRRLLDALAPRGSPAKSWDVLCWRGEEVVFCESKLLKRDHIRDTQRAWLEAGLRYGLPSHAFLVVEWSLETLAAPA